MSFPFLVKSLISFLSVCFLFIFLNIFYTFFSLQQMLTF